jgi:phage gpG-like protein
MSWDFSMEDNTDQFKEAASEAIQTALEMIGIKAEKYAKGRCPVGTPESTGKKGYRGGTLRNSITHQVTEDQLIIGSNVEYAPYVELGTGPYFEVPPAWEQFTSEHGQGISSGYVRPRPFIRPALEDHMGLYQKILNDQLSGMGQ